MLRFAFTYAKKAQMSRFPDALRSALKVAGWTQSEISRQSKAVTPSTVGRYLAGIDLPKPDTLDKLVAPFPVCVREELTAAYLAEHIPLSVRERVTVIIQQEGQTDPVIVNPEQPLPGSHLERILRTLGRAALTNLNLFHILDALAAPLEGRSALINSERDDLEVRSVEEQRERISFARREMEAAERALAEQEAREPEATVEPSVRYAKRKKK